MVIMFYRDSHLSAGRCELKGVRQQVHHHLIEVLAVDPYGQVVAVVDIAQFDILAACLYLEQRIDVLNERYKVVFAHAHHHLSLLDLPEVHHLVDQVEDTFRVALDGLVDAMPVGIGVFLDERHDRCEDQRHRSADLMTDIHEEAQLGLTHLLGVDMLLQAQVILFLTTSVGEVGIECQGKQQEIEQLGPEGEVPHGMDHHGELLDVRLCVADDCLHSEMIGA